VKTRVAAIIVALSTIVANPAFAAALSAQDDGCTAEWTGYCPTAAGDGYVYIYDPSAGTISIVPVSEAGNPDPQALYQYSVSPECPQAGPFDSVNCTGAAEFCSANGESGLHELIWRRELTPVFRDWSVVGHVCTGSLPTPITVAQLAEDVGEYERDHMPIPTANVQPTGVAIVNLPVLVSATPLGPQTMQVQQPVPGELVATPTYTWTFDDGGTATGPGTAYDGTDPRTDPAHYALHIYRAANEHASVTLTVTWNATFSVAGQTFPIPQLVMPPITTTFSVREAHSVLVSG
jgi:hypothetical protein